MPDIDLKRLRNLRRKAEELGATLVSDLKPFRHPQPTNGFCRKPDSPTDSDDINVTTTCSCLMALSSADKLHELYENEGDDVVSKTFTKLVQAPWMSSGLTENNAFTTTLVFRLFGYLQEIKSPPNISTAGQKFWEPGLEFFDFKRFALKLTKKRDPLSKYLFELFPEELQRRLSDFVRDNTDSDKIKAAVTNEIERLIRSATLNEKRLLVGIPLSDYAKSLRNRLPNAYVVAQLNRMLLHDAYASYIQPIRSKTMKEIALEMSSDPNRFKINDYPPSTAVLYWFIDGIRRANFKLKKEDWKVICNLAADEFRRQRSLVVAKHDAMMDPVAMAMSACLCSHLRSISSDPELRIGRTLLPLLPSSVELESSIIELFHRQTASGIWPKYFPLFHYQDAGSNFCFTFELLEAVLVEFGGVRSNLLTEDSVVAGLERAVAWCDTNRLDYPEVKNGESCNFRGWNSGGNLETLKRNQPESWATAVVHMFLSELNEVLSRHIQKRLHDQYLAHKPEMKWNATKDLLDIDLLIDNKPRSLKKTIKGTIIESFKNFRGKKAEVLRKKPVKKMPLSALLFGPPGTSKTEIAKAIAKDLDWPLVEIDPSHFLQDSFQNIYVQAERIFEDVMDLTGAVVLFDEMDALVQKRDAETALDTESKFLTTYMLPKLAKLHDRGRIVFLMATNFQAGFDDAIKRAGRFDLLLCMGPPTLRAKCNGIHVFYGSKETDITEQAGKLIRECAAEDPWVSDQLELYTYGEFLSFLTGIAASPDELVSRLKTKKVRNEFAERVRDDSRSVGLKRDDLDALKNYPPLKSCKTLKEFDRAEFDGRDIAGLVDVKLPVVKYLLDRKQTKFQFPQLPKHRKGKR